jgi:hypothetical protein
MILLPACASGRLPYISRELVCVPNASQSSLGRSRMSIKYNKTHRKGSHSKKRTMHEIVRAIDTRDDNHATPNNHLKTRTHQPVQVVRHNLDVLSMQPFHGTKYVGGAPSDNISEPTVKGSFSDEDFRLSTEKSFITTHGMHMPSGITLEDNDDDLSSLGSINTKALLQITELSTRLRIQENTKLELFNQCLRLESRLEKNDCEHFFLRMYKTENNKLREGSAKMERDFMNEMNEIVTKMTDMSHEYEDKLQQRDLDIKIIEEELRLLKVAKNLDDISTIETNSINNSKSIVGSGSSSITK